MALKFAYVVDLFSRLGDLEDLAVISRVTKREKYRCEIQNWFKAHHRILKDPNFDRLALLSTFFPEDRPDRRFGLKEARLERILPRCLRWGASALQDFACRKRYADEDFAYSVSLIQCRYDAGISQHNITLAEVDTMLQRLAATCVWSEPYSAPIKNTTNAPRPEDILRPILSRLPSAQVRWLIRLILRSLSPIDVTEHKALIMALVHPALPIAFRLHSSLTAAIASLETREHQSHLPLVPEAGIKIARPQFVKGRSIKQCLSLIGDLKYVVEPKYDGEYCQVHVSLSEDDQDVIKIFSKSGRDSTSSRRAAHSWIRATLGIDRPGRRFERNCILEGELLAYDCETQSLLPFDRIRHHIAKPGSGFVLESALRPNERLIIIFYDCLLVDDKPVLMEDYSVRREHLNRLTHESPCMPRPTSFWAILDFLHYRENSETLLKRHFARAMAHNLEGLILKPACGPYLSLDPLDESRFRPFIKLKKDYIPGLGDTADMAIVAGRKRHDVPAVVRCLPWTEFYLACLENKEKASKGLERAQYQIVATVSAGCLSPKLMETVCRICQSRHQPFIKGQPEYDLIRVNLMQMFPAPDAVFNKPLVADVLGSGFSKINGSRLYALRHCRILKIHTDRSALEAISIGELQLLARQAKRAPEDETVEAVSWLARIQAIDDAHMQRRVITTSSPYQCRKLCPVQGTIISPSTPLSLKGWDIALRGNVMGPSTSPLARQKQFKRSIAALSPSMPIDVGTCKRHRREQCQRLSPRAFDSGHALKRIENEYKLNPRMNAVELGNVSSAAAADLAMMSISPTTVRNPFSPSSDPEQSAGMAALPLTILLPSSLLDENEDEYEKNNRLNVCHMTADLRHWSRESLSMCPSWLSVVGESQAYDGLRKVVVLDTSQPHFYVSVMMVQEVMKLDLHPSESVEACSVSLLHDLEKLALPVGIEEATDELSQVVDRLIAGHSIGTILPDIRTGKNRFVRF